MVKHIIIVLSGGGAKGLFEVGVLQRLEERAGDFIANIADAMVSTSIGAVNTSLFATKEYSAKEISEIMLREIPKVFKKRFNLPINDREEYGKLYSEYIEQRVGKKLLLGDVDKNVHVVMTTTDMCDGLNHFLKSDKEDEANKPIIDIVYKSFAAPYFFGQINDPIKKSILLDGGCGIENLPLWQAYVEAWKRGWFKRGHQTHILAVGCGSSKFWVDYKEGSKGGSLRQTIRAIRYFNSITKGSLARNQSSAVQVRTMESLSQFQPNFSFQFIDWPTVMPKKLDKMNNVKARYEYYRTGLECGGKIDLDLFKV